MALSLGLTYMIKELYSFYFRKESQSGNSRIHNYEIKALTPYDFKEHRQNIMEDIIELKNEV